jgi:type IV secretory pathway component VirB8
MADNEPQTKPKVYLESGNLEAHIIADMLRIENITTELKEFKTETKERLNKLENWIIGIVAITVTTLLTVLSAIVINVLTP